MDYYDNILKAINFIESNLTNDMNLSDIISCTGFSKFHFARIFKAISGYTINEYIRRRRMTEAAKLLTNTDMRIVEAAVLYGYNSQEAFTRAFKEVFNVTPNYYRVNKLSYDNLNQLRLSEQILNFKDEEEFQKPEIVEKDSFLLAGLEYQGNNNNFEVPKLWNELREKIASLENGIYKEACYGLEQYDETSLETGKFKYLASYEVESEDSIPTNMKAVKIERSKYAVFYIKAIVENIPRSISKIYSIYLPETGLKIRGDYDFEYYDNNFSPNSEEGFLYLYIPIED